MSTYIMATVAHHKLGDISRDKPDLCVITGRTADGDYIGRWVEGFGYFNVRFPKATTRELTDAERAHYNGARLDLGGAVLGPIRVDGSEETR